MNEFREKYGKRPGVLASLLLPVLTIICAACLILFFASNAVPGQFAGRNFQIPGWAAVVAALGLVLIGISRFKRKTSALPPKD